MGLDKLLVLGSLIQIPIRSRSRILPIGSVVVAGDWLVGLVWGWVVAGILLLHLKYSGPDSSGSLVYICTLYNVHVGI